MSEPREVIVRALFEHRIGMYADAIPPDYREQYDTEGLFRG